MKSNYTRFCKIFIFLLLCGNTAFAQQSVAREWNEVLLDAIRVDLARPTVHARNLFHTSIAMYDAWAVYDGNAETYFLGKKLGNYTSVFTGVPTPMDKKAAQQEAISYAMYRLLKYRFKNSPGAATSLPKMDELMIALGYDTAFVSTNYTTGPPAALGNYIAASIISFGLQDNSNEQNAYGNFFYRTVNPPLIMALPGNPDLVNPNRWQPLTLQIFIDQNGNVIPGNTPSFLGPEWGKVVPFALTPADRTIYQRTGADYWVYHDPGAPPHLDTTQVGGLSDEYKWNFSLVSAWSGQLDPSDSVLWDISPAHIGNIKLQDYPTTITGLRNFYNLENGGDIGKGYTVNPVTGQPYTPQIVLRGDYARVLAEFWADGPNSETPPGHWFTILNYISDHPLLEKKFQGKGDVLDDLEWDVKAYFILSGAVHDAAVTAWGIKGWYDFIRPVSAIRYMGGLGQSSDPNLPHYHPGGLKLIPGYIELVQPGDPLAGENDKNVGKIKVYAWRGPNYILDPATDDAGAAWILSENWWPYQRPSFVTPPFAGYISGHSTFSRAAAEVLTMLTGNPFFPGGMSQFSTKKNQFLVFEEGPSQDLTLQWATYRDASDQCSLSRIWGGIHPPFDDMPGRLIGREIGINAFHFAERYFRMDEDGDGFFSYEDCDDTNALVYPDAPEIADSLDNDCNGLIDDNISATTQISDKNYRIFPNPVTDHLTIDFQQEQAADIRIFNTQGQLLQEERLSFGHQKIELDFHTFPSGIYYLAVLNQNGDRLLTEKVVKR